LTGSNTLRAFAPKPQKPFDDALNVKYIVERRRRKKNQPPKKKKTPKPSYEPLLLRRHSVISQEVMLSK
jgi:hypothetical protein